MERKNEWIKRKIENAHRDGILVRVEGLQCPEGEGKHLALIKEEADYMSDYITDESGKIIEIDFNRISQKK